MKQIKVNYMNNNRILSIVINLLTVLCLALTVTAQAQDRFTAESYLATPEKYDGKKVSLNVAWVDVPAIYANEDKGYRDFLVYSCAQQQNQGGVVYVPRGEIVIRVPTSESEAFVRRHGTSYNKMWYGTGSGNRVRQICGVFRKMRSVYGGYLDLTDGSSADYEPRVSWLNGRYVRSPNVDEKVPVGQTKAER